MSHKQNKNLKLNASLESFAHATEKVTIIIASNSLTLRLRAKYQLYTVYCVIVYILLFSIQNEQNIELENHQELVF